MILLASRLLLCTHIPLKLVEVSDIVTMMHPPTLDETACNQTIIGRTASEMGPSYETTADATIHASPEAKEDSEDTSRL